MKINVKKKNLRTVEPARTVPKKNEKKKNKPINVVLKKKKVTYLRQVDLRHYGVKLNYGVMALRHLRFTAFYYGYGIIYDICQNAEMV